MTDQALSDAELSREIAPPQPRAMGAVNWLGLWTLYKKEVRRFLKVHSKPSWRRLRRAFCS
jgi:ABC-2 type transport system permease protein